MINGFIANPCTVIDSKLSSCVEKYLFIFTPHKGFTSKLALVASKILNSKVANKVLGLTREIR
jgi:hypothetical protein